MLEHTSHELVHIAFLQQILQSPAAPMTQKIKQ
jgi:hypothetical protein